MEDQDELLLRDDESLGDETPEDKAIDCDRQHLIYVDHTRVELIIIKILLIFLTLAILIIFPLYTETINVQGNVYSLFFTNTLFSSIFLILLTIGPKLTVTNNQCLQIFKLPVGLIRMIQMSFTYFLSGLMILYALDRKRVACHLQDPLTGLVLCWAFLYYFLFYQKFICLKKIFSIIMVLIGAFIAVDYSLCNEFKCRGFERQRISDDAGDWTSQNHLVWTLVYIGGLAFFAAYLSTLEQTCKKMIQMACKSQLILVVEPASSPDSTDESSTSTENQIEGTHLHKRINIIRLAMWLHIFGMIIAVFFFWINFIPQIGKGYNGTEVINYTISGINCHFSNEAGCKNLPMLSVLFLFVYVAFVLVSMQLVILTQSALYTVATMTTAIPLAGIWWSCIHTIPLNKGLLTWQPSLTGELISSVLGLPVIIVGLYFLLELHFKDYQRSKRISRSSHTNHVT